MLSSALRFLTFALVLPILAATVSSAAPAVVLEIDARELPRKLLKTKMTFAVQPGTNSFYYPKWIPGIHAPRGPVENLAGLRFTTRDGKALPWLRDEVELYQFHVEVPEGTTELTVELDYITNQPNSNSSSVDSFGNAFIGTINLNTCVLYPAGTDAGAVTYQPALRLPPGWKHASALAVTEAGEAISFAPVTLEVLIDSPIIAGEHLRSHTFTQADFPPVYYHVNSESAAALQLGGKRLEQFEALAIQGARLFRTAPFNAYHFLVNASDDFPGMGLEHTASSLNGVPEATFTDDKKWQLYIDVLPHELVHAWCGKWRRPVGMVTGNYHDDNKTGGLWVYEGLTQYLGHLLHVRSGMASPEENLQQLARTISRLQLQKGRQWRPLKDTAVDSWHLRGASKSWEYLRRRQDYYNEGLFVWLEVDAILRSATNNEKSLDDFSQSFFRHQPGDGLVKAFDYDEVVAELNKLHQFDWDAFFEERVFATQEALPLTAVERLGYRIEYSNTPSDWHKLIESNAKYADAYESLGIAVRESGEIVDVIPGSPADLAKLAPGQQLAGVNGRKFSLARFREGIADTTTRRNVELLVLNGDRYATVTVPYDGGARFMQLVRNPAAPDLLDAIFKAR